MKTALYAGSFDPFTKGHYDILEQACQIFDKVVVAVAYNSGKKGFLPVEKRLEIIKKSVKNLNNVIIDCYEGLTVEYAKKNNINVLVRGIRNTADFEYEMQIANTNKAMDSQIQTVFFMPKPENINISSSIVREIYLNDGDISKFIISEAM